MKKFDKITVPKHLNPIAQYHYKSLVCALKEKEIFESVDKGVVEMLASLYADFRNMDLSPSDRRQAIKTYATLIKEYGGTPASRQQLKLKPEKEEPSYDDGLSGFFQEDD